MQALAAWRNRVSRTGTSTLSLVLLGLVAALDFVTGPELSPVLFYLAPVGLASWYAGRREGLFTAARSGVAVYVADHLSGGAYSHYLVPLWNTAGRLAVFCLIGLLLSGLRRALEHERELASTDALTGVSNARSFYRQAAVEISRARRYGRPLTLAYLDLDNFKPLNDESGHSTGHEALRVVAHTLEANLRDTDLLARLGGDEFVVLLPETDEPAARAVFSKLLPLLLQEVRHRHWPISCSVGAVIALPPPLSVDDLVRSADQLMYRVKREAKNDVRYEVRREVAPWSYFVLQSTL